VADLTTAQIDGFHDGPDPHAQVRRRFFKGPLHVSFTILIVFNVHAVRTPTDSSKWLPPYAATLSRETHVSDPLPPQGLKFRSAMSYADGLGREIQRKIQAEPGPLLDGGPVIAPRLGRRWLDHLQQQRQARPAVRTLLQRQSTALSSVSWLA